MGIAGLSYSSLVNTFIRFVNSGPRWTVGQMIEPGGVVGIDEDVHLARRLYFGDRCGVALLSKRRRYMMPDDSVDTIRNDGLNPRRPALDVLEQHRYTALAM